MTSIAELSSAGAPAVPPLIGGGEMGQRIRDTDWSVTPLGAYEQWPQSLRSALSMVLNAKGIAALYWGPEQWLLYNDAYGTALGDRHPWAFGRPMPEALSDLAPVLGPQVAEVLRTGDGFAVENLPMVMDRHGRKEDTVWTYNYSPVQGESGGFAGVLLLATEMTRHKMAERSEAEGRTRLETALKVARLGTFDWQPFSGLIEMDARSAEIFGLPTHGLMSHEDAFACIAPEDLDRIRTDTAALMGIEHPFNVQDLGRAVDFNYDLVLADGSRRSILSSGAIVENPDGTRRMVGSFNDVTDLKRAEARLREQNATLEQQVAERTSDRNALWQLSAHIMLRCTFEGEIAAVNPAWGEVLGWREDELLGTNLFALIHPDDVASTIEGARRSAEGIAYARFDNRYRHRDGSYRWISWSTRPAEGLINAVGRDITAEKEQAEALAQAEDALRQSQKMEAVGQLTGGIAHDFNNLLAAISGGLQVIKLKLARGQTEGLGRYVDIGESSIRRAAALTQRLLAFSRRQTLDPKPVNANRMVSGMEDLIRRTVGPAIELEVVGAGGLWTTQVDPPQLENVLLNLCINARDAMLPGGGRLTIETANKWLDDRAAAERELPPGQYISLCVTDTGTGIASEVVKRIFDPFFTTKPTGQGTGLGLSMVYGFARQSGGQIGVYTEVGHGTTMCLYLPRHIGEVEQDAAVGPPSAFVIGDGETVLVVEDEDSIRMLIAEVLEEIGYRVLQAADGPAGLRLLQGSGPIDLLVSDVGLPGGLNGRQVADAGRALRPKLKVLFLTGYAENAAVGNGLMEAGMQVMTKPFDVEGLTNKVREMLKT